MCPFVFDSDLNATGAETLPLQKNRGAYSSSGDRSGFESPMVAKGTRTRRHVPVIDCTQFPAETFVISPPIPMIHDLAVLRFALVPQSGQRRGASLLSTVIRPA